MREIVIVVGKTGTGKSYWIKNYIRYLHTAIVDVMYEYDYPEYDNVNDIVENIIKKSISISDIRLFDTLCACVYYTGNMTLVVEEAQRVIPSLDKLSTHFENIIYRGRHRNVSLLLAAQRASSINIAVRSQYTKLIVFKQTEKRDLDWICNTTGYDIAEDIRNLDNYQHFIINTSDYQLVK